MTFCLPVEAVVALNHKVTGNGGLLRDPGGLEGALARPMQTFGGQDLHPTVIAKAAVLLHGIATTQHFFDGNKRTAWMACQAFLEASGMILMAAADAYADDFVVNIATGRIGITEIGLWLLAHLEE